MEPRPSSESEVLLAQQMLPTDANPAGDVHGGVVMKLIDTAGALAAIRHARSRVVTAEVDSMTFDAPVHVGDLLEVRACVTWVGRTSIESEVEVVAENVVTGARRTTSTAFVVYVALDGEGKPRPVPPLAVATDEDRQRWSDAEARRAIRLQARSRRRGPG